jgi:hypothetical protein
MLEPEVHVQILLSLIAEAMWKKMNIDVREFRNVRASVQVFFDLSSDDACLITNVKIAKTKTIRIIVILTTITQFVIVILH